MGGSVSLAQLIYMLPSLCQGVEHMIFILKMKFHLKHQMIQASSTFRVFPAYKEKEKHLAS